MPTLVIKGKITKGNEYWVKEYDQAKELRDSKYGIKTIYWGHHHESSKSPYSGIYPELA